MLVFRNATIVALAAACAAILSACGGDATTAGAETVNVGISDAGCSPAVLKLTAGPKNFVIKSTGTGTVTEYEILDGTRILGEREGLAPGIDGKFSLNLKAGEYVSYCPDGELERGKIIVAPTSGATDVTSAPTADLKQAVKGYRAYVREQSEKLVDRTTEFVTAVKAGDVAKAKQLFAYSREPFETIEPVAESFGGLDPAIDARVNDVAEGDEWTGFHRIEQALWQRNTTDGMDEFAEKLLTDVKTLRKKAATLDYQPAELANGATGLLGEVSKSKITGEEDRYSHTDLWDFAANVDGSHTAYKLLRPALTQKDAELADTIDDRFAAVDTALADYRNGDGFVLFTNLSQTDTKKLSRAIDALAEPLSQVAAHVVS